MKCPEDTEGRGGELDGMNYDLPRIHRVLRKAGNIIQSSIIVSSTACAYALK